MRAYLHTNRNQLPMDCLVLYCYQLAMAVSYLESKKFVHRFAVNFDICVFVSLISEVLFEPYGPIYRHSSPLYMIVWAVYGVSACGVPVYSPAFACCCCTCRWKRMSWRRWLITYGDASTLIQLHLSTNQAQCRAAALIQTNMLPLCQGEVDNSRTCSCFSNHCTKIRPC